MPNQLFPPEVVINLAGTFEGRNALVFNVLGRRAGWNTNSGMNDICAFLSNTTDALAPELAGTEALEVVSSSANDTAAGTGTRTINIVYIDTSGALARKAGVTLNGVTPVALDFKALMILWMEAVTGGSSEVSVGNIDLRTVAGSVVQERIGAGANKSLSARFMVPTGYIAYIPYWDIHVVNADIEGRLRATVKSYDRSLCSRYKFQDTAYMALNTNGEHSIPFMKYPTGCKIKVSAVPSSVGANVRADVSFPVILVAG